MEGHYGETPLCVEHALGGLETALELSEFVVHRDAERLERAGRGMDVLRAAAQRALDDGSQFTGAADWAGSNDRARDGLRPLLLAIGARGSRRYRQRAGC